MSACISSRGEYSSHELDGSYTCTFCGVLDEDAMTAELERLRREVDHVRLQVKILQAESARTYPVYQAAVAWRRSHGSSVDVIVDGKPGNGISTDELELRRAVDRALKAVAP